MGADVNLSAIEPGMAVYGADDKALGPVEAVHATGINVLNHSVPAAAIARVDAAGVHLLLARAAFASAQEPWATGAGADPATHGDQLVIPVVEERMVVGTREVDQGEIIIRKRVITEERMVPVTLRREEIEIVRRAAGQPWPTGADADEQGVEVTRIPLRSEEPAIGVSQIVTREVVIDRDARVEERQVAGTVRREQIEVEERYRAGFSAANDPRYAGRDFAAVEADLRREHGADGAGDDARWQRLREEMRAGWEAARGRE